LQSVQLGDLGHNLVALSSHLFMNIAKSDIIVTDAITNDIKNMYLVSSGEGGHGGHGVHWDDVLGMSGA